MSWSSALVSLTRLIISIGKWGFGGHIWVIYLDNHYAKSSLLRYTDKVLMTTAGLKDMVPFLLELRKCERPLGLTWLLLHSPSSDSQPGVLVGATRGYFDIMHSQLLNENFLGRSGKVHFT